MDDLMKAMQDRATKQTDLNERLTEIFMRHFKLREEDGPDAPYAAYGLMGVDVALILSNMFLSIKHDRGALNIVRDLTFTLNANKVWQNGSAVLVPLIQAATNAQTDALFLKAERLNASDNYQLDDALITLGRTLPLEIFPILAFLIGGPQLMQECSLPLKRELAPYFLS